MTLVTNTFEASVADGTAVTMANSAQGGDALAAEPIVDGASVTYSTAASQKGTKSMLLAYTNVAGQAGVRFSQAAPTAANALRFYFRMGSLPSVSGLAIFSCHSTSLTDRRFYATVTNAGALYTYDFAGGANFSSTTGQVAINTWYRVELGITAITGSAGSSDLKIYLADDTTPIPALSSTLTDQNYGGSALANIQLGRFNMTSPPANGSPNVYYDDFAWNSGSTAPLGPSGTAPTTTITYGTHIHIG